MVRVVYVHISWFRNDGGEINNFVTRSCKE